MRHGSQLNPPNRFEKAHVVPDLEHVEWDTAYLEESSSRPIEYIEDRSESIVSQNTSPDVPFTYSINPYRGCLHGCSYCYARPTHEYLSMNAGLDFETKIVVKPQAARLFRSFLSRKKWRPEPIVFSGVTDCYQPAERQFRLTRDCLGVALEHRQPVGIITKNALVCRDLDLLRELAADQLVQVFVSITTLDNDLARDMEPRTSTPAARLRAVETIARAQVPVGVMVAPIIPGLNDTEIPAILDAVGQAGAIAARYILVRLPLTVEPVFREWLERTQPLKAQRVLSRLRDLRDGKLNSSTFGERMTGSGPIADQIRDLFALFRARHGLNAALPPLDGSRFRVPDRPRQLELF